MKGFPLDSYEMVLTASLTHSRTSVKTSYLVRAAQNTLEAYRYIDCGTSSTIHQPSGLVWSKPQSGKLLR